MVGNYWESVFEFFLLKAIGDGVMNVVGLVLC
jgi:hypothetical protein